MPAVSIIIPTYNRTFMLKDAIESVKSQTYKDFELIIIDDGSTEPISEIVSNYKNVKYLYQKNQGISSARNTGIQNSCAEFIAFLDSDDIWLPTKLEEQLNFFKNNPKAKICYTDEIWHKNNILIKQKKHHKKRSGNIFNDCLNQCFIGPSTVMINRQIFKELGLFDVSLPVCEDYDMWLRISCKYPIFLINKPLIIKRAGHSDQLSMLSTLDKYRIQSLAKLLKSDTLTELQKQAATKILLKKCKIYANGCIKRGKIEEANFIYSKIAMSTTF